MNMASGTAKILLIAVDGLSFPLLQKWVAAGDLPVMKRLMEGGCYGVCNPFTPSNSAVIWTSVMTGMRPRETRNRQLYILQAWRKNLQKDCSQKNVEVWFSPTFHLAQK